jgi:hypothetical protein
MKCLFAIPENASARVQTNCTEYVRELEAWTPAASALADRLGTLVETIGSGQLRLTDDDWSALRSLLEENEQDLALREIFWSTQDARKIVNAISELGEEQTPYGHTVRSWLNAEIEQGSSIVALTR